MAKLASVLLLFFSARSSAEQVLIDERFVPGYQYRVTSKSEIQGTLNLASAAGERRTTAIEISGASAVEYVERILPPGPSSTQKTLRLYWTIDFRRKTGGQLQETSLRPQVRRLAVLRNKQTELAFSPDGPLTWAELDLVRADAFTPALSGLLPAREVRPGDRWPASTPAIEELTDLELVKTGLVECAFQEVVERGGRRFAQVGFAGTVSGVSQDGPSRQRLDGTFYFDLQSNHLSYLSLNGTCWFLDREGNTIGRIEGKYVLTRTLESHPQLSALAIRDLVLEPTDENTPLLFHEPSLGVTFAYSRRWTVRKADARQIVLEEPRGGGLLITLEPLSLLPTTGQFQDEVHRWLAKQAARVSRNDPPRRLQGSPDELDQFALEAEMNQSRYRLEYYLARQPAGGATLAARVPIPEAEALKKDVERIARSLKLIPPKQPTVNPPRP